MNTLDLSVIKETVDKNINRLIKEFGLSSWRIDVVYTTLNGLRAEIEIGVLGSYERAEIRFDIMSFTTVEQIVETLQHELLHIVIFPFEQYSRTIDEVIPKNVKTLDQELWRHQSEQMIRNLEKLVSALRDNAATEANK